MRIAIGCIGHETNTFTSMPTTLADFKKSSYYVGQEIITAFSQTSSVMGGFIEVAAELEIEIVPLLWTFATPAGPIQQSAYVELKAELLDLLEKAGQLDAIFLDLHGAMVTETHEDAEGDLLSAVRQQIGTIPLVITLDLHANITAEMAEQSDAIIGFDTYPHVDCHARGFEAAHLLHAILSNRIRPTMAYRQLPLLTSPPAQCTMKSPMSEVIERLHVLESRPGVITATLSMGFPFADIYDAGVSILVTTDDNQDLAEQCATEFAAYIWDMREAFRTNLVSITEAIEYTRNTDGRPIILAEGSDNPGGGGPCDGTFILRALIEADVEDAVVALIADPESVDRAIQAGIGQYVDLNVGGKTHPLHGEPVALTGYVKTISDGVFVYQGPMAQGLTGKMGRTVVVKIGGVEIILTDQRLQPYDAEVLRSLGIAPEECKLIALKSAVHFRADYTPIAHAILEIDTPGVHSPNLLSYAYNKLRRPIFPLDDM